MNVRAKFVVQRVVDSPYDSGENQGKEVILWAVSCGSKENEEFFKYTPSGTIQLSIVNPTAAEQFEPGKEYYVDFIKAE